MNAMPKHRSIAYADSARARRGLTLVEMLLVIVILGILGSMSIMAIAQTQNSARDARTRGTITKLNSLIMAKWDTYQTRRVPLSIPGGTGAIAAAQKRRDALRDLMRMEMPDLLAEVNTAPQVGGLPIPAVLKTYRKRMASATPEVSSAECLYQIVAYGLAEKDALSQFSEAEIGDTDEDGCKEFIDGWGQPIFFLRWPSKFDSELIVQDATNHHDPFDPLKTDPAAYALYPLIYSAGPDKSRNIKNVIGDGTTPPFRSVFNNPYTDGLGAVVNTSESGHLDNITNHDIFAY